LLIFILVFFLSLPETKVMDIRELIEQLNDTM
jgi:hypothetical protein